MSKGGSTYLTDVLSAVMSLIGSITMVAIAVLVVFLGTITIASIVDGKLYGGTIDDSIVMTYMESTADGYRMRDLLTYAVYFDDVEVYIPDAGTIDLCQESSEIMSKLTDNPYVLSLKAGQNVHILSQNGGVSKGISYKIPIASSQGTAYLELVV